MNSLNSIEEFNRLITDNKRVIIAVFRAEWCGDCHFIDPFIDEVIRKYESSIEAINIDIDSFGEIAKEWSVVGIPSFVAFYKGKVINRFVSRVRKNRFEIESFIEQSIGLKAN